MAKFRKVDMATQASKFIQARTQLGQPKNNTNITSIRTSREYQRTLAVAAEKIKQEFNIQTLSQITKEMAMQYLEQRADIVGQKTLDNERVALQMLNRPGYAMHNHKLERIKADGGKTLFKTTRAYNPHQIQTISNHQQSHNALATKIAYAAGLRQHELFTLRPKAEQQPSKHRPWRDDRFIGREGVIYTVKGKGGLIREVLIPKELAQQLEENKLLQPVTKQDRGIIYQQQYNIGAGQAWAKSFREAAKRGIGYHHGAHGVRHAYAQQRMHELRQEKMPYKECLAIVSQELGHFRPEITEVYLR